MLLSPRSKGIDGGRMAGPSWDLDDALHRVRRWCAFDQPFLALSHLNRWIEDHPDQPDLWYYRACFCGRIGLRLEEARSWREYLRLRPQNRLLARLLADRLSVISWR